MRLVLDKIEEMQPGNLKLKQFAGDLANTLKTTYENKMRVPLTGGVPGAGKVGSSFFESLGLSGMAEAYKEKAEAKEKKHQEKEGFIQNFQKYSDAGQNLSADTSRQVADSLFEELEAKKKELEKLQEEAKKQKDAGYGEDPENKKKQEELLAAIKNIDPRNKENQVDASINDVKSEETKVEAAEVEKQTAEVQTKMRDDLTDLYVITDDYFKKQLKWNEDALKHLETIAGNSGEGGGGGGLLSSAAEMAGDLVGSKGGAAKAGGKVGKLASLAGKAGKFAKVGGGLLAVGTAAYEGYNEYQEADEKVKSGEITKEEGQVKKGEAVGGAVGGAGGALAGAAAGAAIGSVVPVVGTAIGGLIGGAIGYWGGKKAGQAVGNVAVQGYQALSSDGKGKFAGEEVDSSKPLSPKQMKAAEEMMKNGEKLPPDIQPIYEATKKQSGGGQISTAPAATSSAPVAEAPAPATAAAEPNRPIAERVAPSLGSSMAQKRVEVDNATYNSAQNNSAASNMINAPVTNITNNTSTGGAEKPTVKDTTNRDSTFQRYLDRRYYPATAGR